MSNEIKRRLSRRDFIKSITVLVGGVISIMTGLPVIGYLLSPALRKEEDTSTVSLGSLPVGSSCEKPKITICS